MAAAQGLVSEWLNPTLDAQLPKPEESLQPAPRVSEQEPNSRWSSQFSREVQVNTRLVPAVNSLRLWSEQWLGIAGYQEEGEGGTARSSRRG